MQKEFSVECYNCREYCPFKLIFQVIWWTIDKVWLSLQLPFGSCSTLKFWHVSLAKRNNKKSPKFYLFEIISDILHGPTLSIAKEFATLTANFNLFVSISHAYLTRLLIEISLFQWAKISPKNRPLMRTEIIA